MVSPDPETRIPQPRPVRIVSDFRTVRFTNSQDRVQPDFLSPVIPIEESNVKRLMHARSASKLGSIVIVEKTSLPTYG